MAKNTLSVIEPVTVEEIKTLFAEAETRKGQLEGGVRAFLEVAIELGEKLCAKKEEIGFGGWLTWLARNVPEIADRTARKYMQVAKIANRHGHANLPDSLEQVLAICDTNEEDSEPKPAPATVGTWVSKTFSGIFSKARLKPVESWKDEEKSDLAFAIKELIKLANVLGISPNTAAASKAQPITLEAKMEVSK